MSSTDLIGWASLAAFAASFVALFFFITRPSRRLEKVLGEGLNLGLRRLHRGSADWDLLAERLAPLLGVGRAGIKFGSVYQSAGGGGFLLSMTEKRKSGSTTSYSRSEKYLHLGATGIDKPFSVMPKPPDGLLSNLAFGLLQKLGMKTITDGLLPDFEASFWAQGESAAVPDGVQRAFISAQRAGSERWNLLKALAGTEGVAFRPEGFVIHLSGQHRLKAAEDFRPLFEFAESLVRSLRFR